MWLMWTYIVGAVLSLLYSILVQVPGQRSVLATLYCSLGWPLIAIRMIPALISWLTDDVID